MQILLIKINTLDAKPEFALLGKKQAEDRFSPADWGKVRSLTKGRRVVLLLPNNEVVLTSIKIPSKNKKQLYQAVPYALEDTLAEDIEDLHFAIHQETDSSESHVAITSRERLDLYLDFLRKKGISTHFILPQVLAQSIQAQGWSILQHKGNKPTTVRIDKLTGFSCDENLLDIFLTEQLEKSIPESISTNFDMSELPEALQSVSLIQSDSAIVNYQSIENALSLNLLTGFISHKQESNFNWKAWRPPIVLASLIAAAWLGILGWQNNLLKQENNQLSQAIEKTFKSAFPESRIVDAPQQMRSKLSQLKKNQIETVDSPLPLISSISPLLKEYKDLILKEIRYQEDELVLVIQSPNLTRLEAFKKTAAKQSKLKVSIKSSTTTSDKVESLLIISPLANITTNKGGAST